MNVDCECVVIGAGVVGLAIAARLARQGSEVVVLESEADFGTVTSARNSEVIHAGIYYAKDSLKARLCVEGKSLLYAYCKDRAIPFNRCGKLIVATSDTQLQQLEKIRLRAAGNGVHDITLLSSAQALSLEPEIKCTGALLSPSTGILDSHAYMLSLLGDAENHGAVLACNTPVVSLSYKESGNCYQLITGGSDATTLTARCVINAAGHRACELANSVKSVHDSQRIEAVMIKGNYFSLTSKAPFTRLVYPVPEKAGLGVHLTIDMAGQARFGPDVEAVDEENYVVDPQRAACFYEAIRQYWPELPDNALVPAYSGIRPRVCIDGQLYSDFLIQGPAQHGFPGLVNLMSIESPGLTASLAIADNVVTLLQ